eukprot:4333547-Pyramimonas_sp.AAC.1
MPKEGPKLPLVRVSLPAGVGYDALIRSHCGRSYDEGVLLGWSRWAREYLRTLFGWLGRPCTGLVAPVRHVTMVTIACKTRLGCYCRRYLLELLGDGGADHLGAVALHVPHNLLRDLLIEAAEEDRPRHHRHVVPADTGRTDQSDEGRGYIPTGQTNQMRGEGAEPPSRPLGVEWSGEDAKGGPQHRLQTVSQGVHRMIRVDTLGPQL